MLNHIERLLAVEKLTASILNPENTFRWAELWDREKVLRARFARLWCSPGYRWFWRTTIRPWA